MNNRLWQSITMAAWVTLIPVVATWADDSLFGDVRAQWVPVDKARQNENLLRETTRRRVATFGNPSTGFSKSPPRPARNSGSTNQASFETEPSRKPHRPLWATPAQPAEAEKATFPIESRREQRDAGSHRADGTWHEDGRYITINLNGQELRLVKTASAPVNVNSDILERFEAIEKQERPLFQQSNLLERITSAEPQNVPEPQVSTNGSVSGRLRHRGRPMVACRVSIVPLKKAGYGGYAVNGERKPFSGKTDDQGNYFFDDVPPGPYKLFWRPVGDRGWTRHVEYRPDVIVRTGQIAHIKNIRAARRTVN